MRIEIAGAMVFVLVLSLGCAHSQPLLTKKDSYALSAGDKAADKALSLLGSPYKFKGSTPEGFDCSGLVRYSYLAAGMDVPHSTVALRQHTRSVPLREIRKGDLVFFIQRGKKYSHVGIYVGNNQFVHAPSSGKNVRVNSLQDEYWKKHYLGARRF